MSEVSDWDIVAGNNNDPAPDGFPEGMFPSEVNNSSREVMAAIKRWYDTFVDGSFVPAEAGNAATLGGELPAHYLDRANHTNTQDPSTISPQGSGSGLDADTLRGLIPEQIGGNPRDVDVPSWMYNLGDSNSDLNVVGGTTNIASGVHFYRDINITAGTLRHSEQGQLILVCNGTFTMSGGTIDGSGRGGVGGAEGSNNAQGGSNFVGGNGGAGLLGDGIGQPGGSTRWNSAKQPSNPNTAGGSATSASRLWLQILHNWSPDYQGGSGGGSHDGGADSNGGSGGGIVIVIARNFNFTGGTINVRGRENLTLGGDNDLDDSSVGGGGVIITCAHNQISNTGSRLIDAPVPPGFGNGDTSQGGNGRSIHFQNGNYT